MYTYTYSDCMTSHFSSLMTSTWLWQKSHCTPSFSKFNDMLNLCSGSMVPLTNTEILAPLIVGFTLERVELDSLASQYQTVVMALHRQGLSEEEIAKKLCAITSFKNTQVTTLKSTDVYKEPAKAAETISKWVNAEDTPSGRDELLGVCRFIFLLYILTNGHVQDSSYCASS